MLFAIHITSRRKEGGVWLLRRTGAGESNGGGLGFGLGLEVGSAYNIGQTRTQPKSGMEIGACRRSRNESTRDVEGVAIDPSHKKKKWDRQGIGSINFFFLRILARSVDSSSLAGLHCVHPLPEYSMVGDNGWRKGLRTNSSTEASTSTLLPSMHPPCLQSRPCTLYSSVMLIRYQLK